MGVLSSFNAYLPSQTLRDLYQMRPDTTGAIQLYLKDPAQSTVVAERLREQLKQAGHRVMDPEAQPYYMKLFMKVNSEDWTGQKLDVSTWQDETATMSWVLAALQGLSFFLVLILLGIIVAGIVSSMWIAIRERTREIGTLRAIGMHRRGVLRMILLEAGLLGLLGTGAGAVLGIGFSALINAVKIPVPDAARMILMSDTLQLTVTGGSVVFAIVLITIITTLAAVYPAMHAARLKPVTAMHHIG
jgi:ABC-type lipoprotein release transport system permease subunit